MPPMKRCGGQDTMVRRSFSVAAPAFACLLLSPAPERAARADEETMIEDAVVLEETVEVQIASSTEARLRFKERLQVLTSAGVEAFQHVPVFYNHWVDLRELRGAVISPAGKRVELKKQNIVDTGFSYELYSEDRNRVLEFQGVVPGSTIEYEYEQAFRSLFFLLQNGFDLQEPFPIRLKTLTVRAPASFPIRFTLRGGSPEYTREEKDGSIVHRWQVRDVPALKRETSMPPQDDVTPRIEVGPREIVWADHRIDASTWDGIAGWDWELVRDQIKPTAEVDQTARELTAGLQDPEAKIRPLYEFVQKKVDYVSIYLGIGGWQPHSSGDVLHHRY